MYTATDGKYTINISYDEFADSPREAYENLGTMVCWHRRYNLGDEQPKLEPHEFYREILRKGDVFLPLYLLDHSGLTMSTSDFGDPWDSGQVGWIYITAEKARKECNWKRLTKSRRDALKKWLKAEVEVYDEYLRGEVYFAEILEDGETIDSCGGFYGDDGISAALEGLPSDAHIERYMLEWRDD